MRRSTKLPEAPGTPGAPGARRPTASSWVGFIVCLPKKHNKPLSGEKTPDYVKCLPLLHRLFPHVRSVHIIRDGRDVALSARQWANKNKGPGKLALWDEQPVAVCALWWVHQVGAGLRDGRAIPADQHLEVRYEQLVENPQKVLEQVASFLGLPYSQQMLAFNEGKKKNNPRLSAKSAWLGPTPGIRDWRREMDADSVELFEALAGDVLTALGYKRWFEQISPRITELAEGCRTWWNAYQQERATSSATPIHSSKG